MTGNKVTHKVSIGAAPLDDILHGGLTADRMYLIEGMPGTGKTTLALQFLLEGARQGDSGLNVTLSETQQELESGGIERLVARENR